MESCKRCGKEIADAGLCSKCHWDFLAQRVAAPSLALAAAYARQIDAELTALYFETHCHICGSEGSGMHRAAPRLTFAGIDVLCKACEAIAKAFGDSLPKSRFERHFRRLTRQRTAFSFDDFFAYLFGGPSCSSA